MEIYRLYVTGRREEALQLQQKAALAEGYCKSGIASTKFAAGCFSAKMAGIERAEELLRPRRPYEEPDMNLKAKIRDGLKEVAAIEESLINGSK